MGNNDRRSARDLRLQPIDQRGFAVRVERGSGLVEDQQARPAQQRPRKHQPLALTA